MWKKIGKETKVKKWGLIFFSNSCMMEKQKLYICWSLVEREKRVMDIQKVKNKSLLFGFVNAKGKKKKAYL